MSITVTNEWITFLEKLLADADKNKKIVEKLHELYKQRDAYHHQKKLIEDILSSYDIINKNKNMVFEVADTYNNIEFKNIGLGNPASDNINTSLLQDIQTAAKSAGVNVSVTTAISGHGDKTKSNNTSRHTSGNAVDIAMINGKAVSTSYSFVIFFNLSASVISIDLILRTVILSISSPILAGTLIICVQYPLRCNYYHIEFL